MPRRPASPYLVPGVYDCALAAGRHREITGGWWEETGRIQLDLLIAHGMQPHHRLLDIGAGALRLGRKAVPYLDPGNYWATDASGALMRRGWEVELEGRDRLPPDHLIEDADFALPGVPDSIDFAICWGVFTHLPADRIAAALRSLRSCCPRAAAFLFTVFTVPEDSAASAFTQPSGVVTHPDRPPYHNSPQRVAALVEMAEFGLSRHPDPLPRGQTLWLARPSTPFVTKP